MELFGQLPADIPREVVVVADALEIIAGGAEHHYSGLKTIARRLTQARLNETGTPSAGDMANLVASSVALLNTLHRLRLMMKKLPGDKEVRIARGAFESAVKKVEPVRHHVEHLDEKVGSSVFATQGAFGALSWWYEEGDDLTFTGVIPGHVVQDAQAVTRTPTEMREDIDHFWIVIDESIFDLSNTYWAVQKLLERLREWASRQREQGWPTLSKQQRPRGIRDGMSPTLNH